MVGQTGEKMDTEGAVEGQEGRCVEKRDNSISDGVEILWVLALQSTPLKINSGLVEPPFGVNSRVAGMACNRF